MGLRLGELWMFMQAGGRNEGCRQAGLDTAKLAGLESFLIVNTPWPVQKLFETDRLDTWKVLQVAKFNSEFTPEKWWDWKTILSFWYGIFLGAMLNFQELFVPKFCMELLDMWNEAMWKVDITALFWRSRQTHTTKKDGFPLQQHLFDN